MPPPLPPPPPPHTPASRTSPMQPFMKRVMRRCGGVPSASSSCPSVRSAAAAAAAWEGVWCVDATDVSEEALHSSPFPCEDALSRQLSSVASQQQQQQHAGGGGGGGSVWQVHDPAQHALWCLSAAEHAAHASLDPPRFARAAARLLGAPQAVVHPAPAPSRHPAVGVWLPARRWADAWCALRGGLRPRAGGTEQMSVLAFSDPARAAEGEGGAGAEALVFCWLLAGLGTEAAASEEGLRRAAGRPEGGRNWVWGVGDGAGGGVVVRVGCPGKDLLPQYVVRVREASAEEGEEYEADAPATPSDALVLLQQREEDTREIAAATMGAEASLAVFGLRRSLLGAAEAAARGGCASQEAAGRAPAWAAEPCVRRAVAAAAAVAEEERVDRAVVEGVRAVVVARGGGWQARCRGLTGPVAATLQRALREGEKGQVRAAVAGVCQIVSTLPEAAHVGYGQACRLSLLLVSAVEYFGEEDKGLLCDALEAFYQVAPPPPVYPAGQRLDTRTLQTKRLEFTSVWHRVLSRVLRSVASPPGPTEGCVGSAASGSVEELSECLGDGGSGGGDDDDDGGGIPVHVERWRLDPLGPTLERQACLVLRALAVVGDLPSTAASVAPDVAVVLEAHAGCAAVVQEGLLVLRRLLETLPAVAAEEGVCGACCGVAQRLTALAEGPPELERVHCELLGCLCALAAGSTAAKEALAELGVLVFAEAALRNFSSSRVVVQRTVRLLAAMASAVRVRAAMAQTGLADILKLVLANPAHAHCKAGSLVVSLSRTAGASYALSV